MVAAYLWLNSILYALFALFCSLNINKTSQAVGFESLSNSGRSEYLTVYGGMELGRKILDCCFPFSFTWGSWRFE
jgi:hypothetical protein